MRLRFLLQKVNTLFFFLLKFLIFIELPAKASIIDFSTSFNSKYWCRICLADKYQTQNQTEEHPEMLRTMSFIVKNLGLLIGDLIPVDHKVWKLYLSLREMIDIILSPSFHIRLNISYRFLLQKTFSNCLCWGPILDEKLTSLCDYSLFQKYYSYAYCK
ncbi:hypothetical protein PUN28_013916 [Cardiocondyla obscurior]|uniref:Uncharacterized protein n=1 Tax=Cardiocondyla obscurior TaxID=286306 RepID=A0AAW2F7B3_9HYME